MATTIELELTYVPELAGGAATAAYSEFDPVAHVFLTHGLTEQPLIVRLSPRTPQSVTLTVDIEGASQRRSEQDAVWNILHEKHRHTFVRDKRTGAFILPPSASLAIDMYVETATEAGQQCRTDGGATRLLLSDVYSGTLRQSRILFQSTADPPLVKGFITVARKQPLKGPAFLFSNDWGTASVTHIQDTGPGAVEHFLGIRDRVGAWVNSSLDVFFGDDAPLAVARPEFMQHMHCPYYQTPVLRIWGSVYSLLLPKDPPEEGVLLEALQMALYRAGLEESAGALADIVEAQFASDTYLPGFTRVCELFGAFLSQYANTMIYMYDFVNVAGETVSLELSKDKKDIRYVHRGRSKGTATGKIIVEAYLIVRLLGGDDCEGLALEIDIWFWQVFRATPPTDRDSPLLRLLAQMIRIAQSRIYIPQLMLAAVTNAKLAPDKELSSSEDANAHTFFLAYPSKRFLEQIDTMNVSTNDAATLAAGEYLGGRTIYPWESEIPVLVGEGTANASSLTLPLSFYYRDPTSAIASYDAKRRLFGRMIAAGVPLERVQIEILTKQYHYTQSTVIGPDAVRISDFYMYLSALYTSAFRDLGVLDFAVADHHPTDGTSTHAVPFAAAIVPNTDDRLRFVPYNDLSGEKEAILRDVLEQLEPVPRLEPLSRRPIPDIIPSVLLTALDDISKRHPRQLQLSVDPTGSTEIPLAPISIIGVRARDLTEETDLAASLAASLRRLEKDMVWFDYRVFFLARSPFHHHQPADYLPDSVFVCLRVGGRGPP